MLTILTLTRESTWSHDPIIRIRIWKNNKGRYIASFTKKGGMEEFRSNYPDNSHIILSEAFVNDILSSLSKVKIVPFPKLHIGSDGEFTILELGGYRGSASFRWWSDSPKEWRTLVQIANTIWSLFLKEE